MTVWLEWANELEEYDSSHGEKPPGFYKSAEMFLDEFAQKLSGIQERHGDTVARQVISLAEIGACPFPWEIDLAAEHLAAGGSIHDILLMEKSGALEDSSDILQKDAPTLGM